VSDSNRRAFLRQLAAASGGAVLLPTMASCGRAASEGGTGGTTVAGGESPDAGAETPGPDRSLWTPTEIHPPADVAPPPPRVRPEGWDPIAWNRERGNAGAIPESYLYDVNGPDGASAHLGKHLPYVPQELEVPVAMVPLMWGNPALGHARHPNAPPSEGNRFVGHWYQWIRLRPAVADEAEETVSVYTGWPEAAASDSGRYGVLDGGNIMADSGRNTIYLAALPPDASPGDVVRVHGYCLTHGEYVDFVEV